MDKPANTNFGRLLKKLGATATGSKPANKVAPRAVPDKYLARNNPLNDIPNFSDSVIRRKVHSAIAEKKIAVFAQPIVNIPQRQTKFFEVFARISVQPGIYLPAARYLELANKEDLTQDIEYLLLINALKSLQKSTSSDENEAFFININTKTLQNRAFMTHLLDFIRKNRSMASKIIFEISQKNIYSAHPSIITLVKSLSKLGCTLSIEQVNDFDFDVNYLKDIGVNFIKINAMTFLHNNGSNACEDFLRTIDNLRYANINVIINKVETEIALRDLSHFLDDNIGYAQGFLFGRPDLLGGFNRRYVA